MATVDWTEALLHPCSICDCEEFSLKCFQKRGYTYDYVHRKWFRDSSNKPIISINRECDYQFDYWKLVHGDKSIEEVMKEEEDGK